MSRTKQSPNETPTRDARKETYEKILRIVELNTGGQQPALMAESSLYQIASQAGLEGEEIGKAYRAAWKHGDLVKIRVNGIPRLARKTEDGLLDIMREEHEKPIDERNEKLMDAVRDLVREVRDNE